jgi:hypothetical protein
MGDPTPDPGSGKKKEKKKPPRRTVESCWALDANVLRARGCLRPGLLSTCRWRDGKGVEFVIRLRYAAEQKLLYLSWRSRWRRQPTSPDGEDPDEDSAGENSASASAGASEDPDEDSAGESVVASEDSASEGDGENMTEVVSIVRSPCTTGGTRPYFLCPGKNGRTAASEDSGDGAVAGCGTAGDGSAGCENAGGDGGGCGRRVLKLYFSRGRFLCRRCGQVVYAAKYERLWQRTHRRANKLRQRLGITALGAADRPKGMLVRTYARLLEAALAAEIRETEAGTKRILQLAGRIQRRKAPPSFTL